MDCNVNSFMYLLMKEWMGDNVRIYFDPEQGAFTGKLAEICNGGLFLLIEGEEYFIPWRNVTYVRHIKETDDVPF